MNHLITIVNILLLKGILLAQAPDILWTKTFGGSTAGGGYSVQETSDGGLIIAGQVGNGNGWLIHTDASGDTLWTRNYGEEGVRNAGRTVQQTSSGGFIMSGGILGGRCTPSCNSKPWLVRIDASGNTIWTRSYSAGSSYWWDYTVQQTSDGGFIVAGVDTSSKVLLLRTDSFGDTLWTRTYGRADIDVGHSVQQTADSGFIVVGNYTILRRWLW